jgi:hypothetical protein
MTGFLDGYEDVNSRIKRFRAEYVSGRIETSIIDINMEKGFILVEARAFREYEDLFPSAIDFAFEVRSAHGVNQNFWVENCVTSAIGRCIGLLMPSDQRPTKQDMEKVERLEAFPAPTTYEDVWAISETIKEVAFGVESGTLPPEAPTCQHGHMIFKEGTSPKSGKPYRGWVCSTKDKSFQCPARWETING